MAVVVILGLAVLWAAVLLPPILRSRSSGGHHGVSDFMDSLRSLGHRSGQHHRNSMLGGPVLHGPLSGPPPVSRNPRPMVGAVGVPSSVPSGPVPYRPMPGGMSPMQRRRRNVLMVLGGAVVVTLLLAFVMRSPLAYFLVVVAVGALAGYCYLLVQLKHRSNAFAAAPMKRSFVTPVDVEDDAPKVGDNVIVLRRNVS